MSINFYYDIITDDGPVPNGIINYKFNKDTWPYPYGQWPDSKINLVRDWINQGALDN